MIEIRSCEDFKDLEEQAVLMSKYSGLLEKYKKRRIKIFFVYLLLGSIVTFLGIRSRYLLTTIFSSVYVILVIYNIIFNEKRIKKNIRRNFRRNYKSISEKFSIDDIKNFVIYIYDDYIEYQSNNSTIKIELKEFVNNYEEPDFYVWEFTQARFVFLKKNSFESKEKYNEIVNKIIASKEKQL